MFLKQLWPAFLWALFVLVLCGLPGRDLPNLSFLDWLSPDKIAHLFLFGIQCYLLLIGFSRQNTFVQLNKHAVLYSLSLSIAYGAIVEVLQTYVFIERSGDVRDALANSLGAYLGYLIYKKIRKKQSLREERSFR